MVLTHTLLLSCPEGRPEKRGKERKFQCPRCILWNPDPRPTLGVDRDDGRFHCWFCIWDGTVEGFPVNPKAKKKKAKSTVLAPPDPNLPGTEVLPPAALEFLRGRGLDPQNTALRYLLRWDGRICWNAGIGWVRRSINPAFVPKVDTRGASQTRGDLIGGHRMYEGADLALVEGGEKAASIPHPWVGVGLAGTYLHEAQAERVVLSKPASVTVTLDGGVPVRLPPPLARAGLPIFVVEGLPKGRGPDDVPMEERVRLLMGARRLM